MHLEKISDDKWVEVMTNDSGDVPEPNLYCDGVADEICVRPSAPHPAGDNQYRWQKLKAPTNTRLLTLRAKRNNNGDPEIDFIMHEFDIKDCPPYIALSYTWGGQPSTEPLWCDGKIILVTKTVWTFLYKIYAPQWLEIYGGVESSRSSIWIDAVSINQNDAIEKAAQVKMIGQMFARAVNVVAWLGDFTPRTEAAIVLINQLKHHFDHLYAEKAIEDIDSAIALNPCLQATPGEQLIALSELMDNAYFSRTWIVQEVAVAQKLYLQIGPDTLRWEILDEVLERVFRHPSAFLGFAIPRHIRLIQLIREIHRTESLSLLEVLFLTSGFKSYDPRDRIFAVLGISSCRDHPELQPDYLRDTEHLYHAVAVYAAQSGLLPFLLKSVTPQATRGDLPSWVPYWSSRASGHSTMLTESFQAGGTELSDSSPTRVEECLTNPDLARHYAYEKHKQITRWLDGCVSLALENEAGTSLGSTTQECTPAEDLWRVLICDRDLEGEEPAAAFAQCFQACRDYHKNMSSDSELNAGWTSPLSLPTIRYQGPLIAALDLRMLASTTSCRLAVVPDASLPQDIVCVLQGLPTAYILRPQENGNFRIIGEAYVDGVMDGEAMQDERYELRQIVIE